MMDFLFSGDTGKTQDEITDKRKRLAYAMLQQGMDMSPVQSPWQGAARLAQALMGGLALRQDNEGQQAGTAAGFAAPANLSASPAKPSGFLSSLFGGTRNAP